MKIAVTVFLFLSINTFGQILPVDSVLSKKKLAIVAGTETVAAVGSLSYLATVWYSDYDHSAFHFFNDLNEWQGMDKIGHMTTSYFCGKIGYDLMRFTGLNEKKSNIYGGGIGLAYLTVVEVFDGFSKEWGFSGYDYLFNTAGTLLFVGQNYYFHDQRIKLKYSFHSSGLEKYRPNLLGENLAQNFIKDYNGQTYWASINISSFLYKENKFPSWLNLAVGYGAEGMIGSFSNPAKYNGQIMPVLKRSNQLYLSLDIDLTKIKIKNKSLKSLVEILSFIKFPMPAVEFGNQGTKFYPIYF